MNPEHEHTLSRLDEPYSINVTWKNRQAEARNPVTLHGSNFSCDSFDS